MDLKKLISARTRGQRRRLLLLVLPALLVAGAGLGTVRARLAPQPQRISLNDLALRVEAGDIVRIQDHGDGGTAQSRSGETLSFYTGEASVPNVLARFGVDPNRLADVTYAVAEPP